MLVLFSLYRCRNWVTEGLSHLPLVTQPVGGGAGILISGSSSVHAALFFWAAMVVEDKARNLGKCQSVEPKHKGPSIWKEGIQLEYEKQEDIWEFLS